MMKNISSNIGNKPVDISLGSLIPSTSYERHFLDFENRSCTVGMQKLADRFVIALFNTEGSVKHDETFGTELISSVLVGSSLNFGEVQAAVAISVSKAEQKLKEEDNSEEYSTELPPDEQLLSAVCDEVSFDPKTSTLRLYVSLTSVAGEDYTYVLPMNLAFVP